MNTIDFLPAHYREKSAQRKTQAWRSAVVAAFCALLAAGALGQYEIRRQLENHLSGVSEQHGRVVADGQKLAELQGRLREARAEAELLTYLRRPWPRTQILARICEPLTDAITLSRLRIHREESLAPQFKPAALPGQTAEEQAKVEAARPVAERRLEKLRAAIDQAPLTVALEGTSEDSASLHVYLGKLAESDWFSAAELGSVERLEDPSRVAFHFVATLTVRETRHGETSPPARSPQTVANRSTSAAQRRP